MKGEVSIWVRHSEGPPFRRSATPKDQDETWIAGWSSLTLTLTLTLTMGIRGNGFTNRFASANGFTSEWRTGPSEWRTFGMADRYRSFNILDQLHINIIVQVVGADSDSTWTKGQFALVHTQ